MLKPNSDHKISNPYLPGLWPLLGITALALLVFLAAVGLVVFGYWPAGVLWLAVLPVALFAAISIIAALQGERQARQIKDFWDSERPEVRWTYTPEEWATLREADWKDAQPAWKLPVGCLAFLLGAAGLLVGGGLAARNTSFSINDLEALLEISGGAVGGAFVGALAGGLIGSIVALGNWLTARQNYRQTTPGAVALSQQEIYALGEYVKLDGEAAQLEQAVWQPGHPARLLITLCTWRPRRTEETWEIMVPDRVLAQVQDLVRQMFSRSAN